MSGLVCIVNVARPSDTKTPVRSERDVLNKVLQLVRSISKNDGRNSQFYEDLDCKNIFIDLQSISSRRDEMVRLAIHPGEIAPRFLDRIFYLLNHVVNIAAFEYGNIWLLKNNRTGEIFDNIGIEYCKSRGKVEDETLVDSLNIEAGDILSVILVKN